MSDTRFLLIGVVLIFVGFLALGIFGGEHQTTNVEVSEFDNCYEYSNDREPIPINCSSKLFEQSIFFGIILVLIAAGIICLIKGAKGNWDSKVKPEDKVGPGGDQNVGNE